MKGTERKATPEQLEALKLFAKANGRYWKGNLRVAWTYCAYDDYNLGGADPGALQQVRNTLGPSWLVRFRLEAK